MVNRITAERTDRCYVWSWDAWDDFGDERNERVVQSGGVKCECAAAALAEACVEMGCELATATLTVDADKGEWLR